jgi:hypothetical protein
MKPILVAMYGEKGTVNNYRTGEVLLLQGIDTNESRLVDWTNYHYGKICEARAKH